MVNTRVSTPCAFRGADHAQRQVGRGHDAVGADGQGRAVLGAGVGDLLAQNVGDIQPLHRDRVLHFHRAGGRCFCRFCAGGRYGRLGGLFNITGLGNIVALPIVAGDGGAHLQTGEPRFAVVESPMATSPPPVALIVTLPSMVISDFTSVAPSATLPLPMAAAPGRET